MSAAELAARTLYTDDVLARRWRSCARLRLASAKYAQANVPRGADRLDVDRALYDAIAVAEEWGVIGRCRS